MKAVIINRAVNEHDINEIERLISTKKYKLFHSNSFKIQAKNDYSQEIDLSPADKKRINYEALDYILSFGEKKINNKAISDLLSIEKVSLWHYYKFRTYFYLRNILYEVELLKKYSLIYDSIIYYGNLPKHFNLDKVTVVKKKKKEKKSLKSTVLFKYAIFFLLRVFISLTNRHISKGRKHIIIDSSLKQIILNPKTLKKEMGNYYLEYLLKEVDDSTIIIDDVSIPKMNDSTFKIEKFYFSKKKNKLFGEIVLFNGLFSKKIWATLKKHLNYLKDQYKIIKAHSNNPVDLTIIDFVSSYHKTSKLYIYKYLCYLNFFQKNHYNTVASVDENSPKIKSIFDAAKALNIKTIGIQHGSIHELHPAYMFTLKDKIRRIMPDYTIVWGDHWKNLLINKGNYSENSLAIAGQIRTDIIPVLYSEEKVVKKILNLKEPYVLFASQPQRDTEIRKKTAEYVFKSMSTLKKVKLIVKLHPSEFNDVNYYHQIAKDCGVTNYSILYWEDLYLLLSQSSIVITSFSTVGAEAVYFRKPLIIIDPLKQDIQNYTAEGVAFQATNQSELTVYIDQIISKELHYDKKAYKTFINKYAYKIDGKAVKRTLDIITNS